MGYTTVIFQKAEKARCPICNSETKENLDEGQVAHYECQNCLSNFLIEKIGTIYYIISHKNENDG